MGLEVSGVKSHNYCINVWDSLTASLAIVWDSPDSLWPTYVIVYVRWEML